MKDFKDTKLIIAPELGVWDFDPTVLKRLNTLVLVLTHPPAPNIDLSNVKKALIDNFMELDRITKKFLLSPFSTKSIDFVMEDKNRLKVLAEKITEAIKSKDKNISYSSTQQN